MIDNDEFLRLMYLLAETHFKYNDMDVTLIHHYEDFINDRNHQIEFLVVTHYAPYIVSRTESTYPILRNGATSYLTKLFSMKYIPNKGMPIDEDNFELLKMLVNLTKEEMELWIKMR